MAVIVGSPFSDLIVRVGRSPVGVLRSAIVRNGRALAPRNVVTPIRNDGSVARARSDFGRQLTAGEVAGRETWLARGREYAPTGVTE